MWYKPKSKNRRLGREHVLVVKLRSSQVRAARIRLLAVTLSLLFITVFGVYLLWRAAEKFHHSVITQMQIVSPLQI